MSEPLEFLAEDGAAKPPRADLGVLFVHAQEVAARVFFQYVGDAGQPVIDLFAQSAEEFAPVAQFQGDFTYLDEKKRFHDTEGCIRF